MNKPLCFLTFSLLLTGCATDSGGDASPPAATAPAAPTGLPPQAERDLVVGEATLRLGPQDAPPVSSRSGSLTVEVPGNASSVRMELAWTAAASDHLLVAGIPGCQYSVNASLSGDGTNTVDCGRVASGTYTVTAKHDDGTIQITVRVVAKVLAQA